MAAHRRGSAGRNRHSNGSRRSTDDIKERLRTSLQKADNKTLSLGGVQDACKDAGLDDATASRINDMALYAAYAVSASVRKSGQSAFTWIPLQGIVQVAPEAVPEAGRAAFTQTLIAAVTGLLKHVEEQESLDDVSGPPDLAEGSRLLHDIMSRSNKVLRMAVSGSGPGRTKSLRATADSVTKTFEAIQLSSGADSQQVVQPYNRLRMELAAAKKLESRASQELDAARPGHDIPPSLKAAAEAVYAHQGPELQKEIAELQRAVLDAQQVLDTVTEQLENLNVDVEHIASAGDQAAQDRTARRKREAGSRLPQALQDDMTGLEYEASAEVAEDADAEDPEEGEIAAEQSQEENAPASRSRRQRKAPQDRSRRHRRRGLADGTQRREEATDEEDEEDEEERAHQDGAGAPAATRAHVASSRTRAGTSPRSSLAEPPGFSPVRDEADEKHGEGPHEDSGRPRRQKKRSGRREKERQARRSLAAAKEPEASGNPPPSAAFGEGFGVHDSSQAWAEDAVVEESKPQRRRDRGRRQRTTEHEASEPGQPSAVAVPPEQARTHSNTATLNMKQDSGTLPDTSAAQGMPGQQVPVRRRARISKLKTVAGTLLDLQNDITDPITQAPLVDPVVAADGYTYERSSIQKHLASSRISPVSGKPMGGALYDNRLVASLLTRLSELPQLGSL